MRISVRQIFRLCLAQEGQSTVEFVVIFVALLAMVVACIALFSAGADGVFLRVALAAASHTQGLSWIGMVQDALLY